MRIAVDAEKKPAPLLDRAHLDAQTFGDADLAREVLSLFEDQCRRLLPALAEEGRPPESIFDFVQGITAVARDKPHQDARLDMEAKAKKLLDRAA